MVRMKRVVNLVLMVGCIFILFGCVRTNKYKVERTDQDVSGNRGYFMGNIPPPLERPDKLDREVLNVDIILPPYDSWKRYRWTDEEVWGNKGYLVGGPGKIVDDVEEDMGQDIPANEKETAFQPIDSNENISIRPDVEKAPLGKIESVPEGDMPTTYKVKKDDTLWKIAGYPEIYGNPSKWTKIYEANKDQINDPDSIKTGIILKIPRN